MMPHLPRYAELWALPYITDRIRQRRGRIRRVWLAMTDHYEPFWRHAVQDLARERVAYWRKRWPEVAAKTPTDSAGRKPRHTFFYPQEQYDYELLASIAELVHLGIADIEVHIHHGGEARDTFIERMNSFCEQLHQNHGLLRRRGDKLVFGFIHGNWALDNSRHGSFCGLNDEISILRDLGCFADFTMPSGASPTQARMINRIYWCTDDPLGPKSYDKGIPVTTGGGRKGDLLMITGPFGLRWNRRFIPRLETGEIAGNDVPTPYRVHRWFDLCPMIGEDLFIKLYTHGAQERNSGPLLQHALLDTYTLVSEQARRQGAELYYVSAWEMFTAVEALMNARDPTPRL